MWFDIQLILWHEIDQLGAFRSYQRVMGSIRKWNEFLKFIENEIKYGYSFCSYEFWNFDEDEKLIETRTNKTTYL